MDKLHTTMDANQAARSPRQLSIAKAD